MLDCASSVRSRTFATAAHIGASFGRPICVAGARRAKVMGGSEARPTSGENAKGGKLRTRVACWLSAICAAASARSPRGATADGASINDSAEMNAISALRTPVHSPALALAASRRCGCRSAPGARHRTARFRQAPAAPAAWSNRSGHRFDRKRAPSASIRPAPCALRRHHEFADTSPALVTPTATNVSVETQAQTPPLPTTSEAPPPKPPAPTTPHRPRRRRSCRLNMATILLPNLLASRSI